MTRLQRFKIIFSISILISWGRSRDSRIAPIENLKKIFQIKKLKKIRFPILIALVFVACQIKIEFNNVTVIFMQTSFCSRVDFGSSSFPVSVELQVQQR